MWLLLGRNNYIYEQIDVPASRTVCGVTVVRKLLGGTSYRQYDEP
jgi:hypothetical protein